MAGLAALIVAFTGLVSAVGVAVVALLRVLFTRRQDDPSADLYEHFNDHIERLEKEVERLTVRNTWLRDQNDRLREELDGKTH